MLAIDNGFEAIDALYREAEQALHEAETVHHELSVPSVNQLRYAGRHVLSALVGADAAAAEEEKQRAQRHCQRAIYDAFDGITSYLLESIADFKADYARIEITPHFPRYHETLEKARNARDLLIKARTVSDDRHRYYTDCRKAARELKSCHDAMELAREELNKAIKNRNRVVYFAWAGIVVALIGVAATVLVSK
ncbi:MAG: hypothetical protein HQL40_15490 [Alphaproteobacteria bacterium]|nr:hypothetical protein [Alphaproteobacteria bacterium]MBF0335027.1 hypothetical protein [Alphaproteobacteria bacterium]